VSSASESNLVIGVPETQIKSVASQTRDKVLKGEGKALLRFEEAGGIKGRTKQAVHG
jgi:hypothetical protein